MHLRMLPRDRADIMPLPGHALDKPHIGTVHELPLQEERGRHTGVLQRIEHLRRVRLVRPVIEGERHALGEMAVERHGRDDAVDNGLQSGEFAVQGGHIVAACRIKGVLGGGELRLQSAPLGLIRLALGPFQCEFAAGDELGQLLAHVLRVHPVNHLLQRLRIVLHRSQAVHHDRPRPAVTVGKVRKLPARLLRRAFLRCELFDAAAVQAVHLLPQPVAGVAVGDGFRLLEQRRRLAHGRRIGGICSDVIRARRPAVGERRRMGPSIVRHGRADDVPSGEYHACREYRDKGTDDYAPFPAGGLAAPIAVRLPTGVAILLTALTAKIAQLVHAVAITIVAHSALFRHQARVLIRCPSPVWWRRASRSGARRGLPLLCLPLRG